MAPVIELQSLVLPCCHASCYSLPILLNSLSRKPLEPLESLCNSITGATPRNPAIAERHSKPNNFPGGKVRGSHAEPELIHTAKPHDLFFGTLRGQLKIWFLRRGNESHTCGKQTTKPRRVRTILSTHPEFHAGQPNHDLLGVLFDLLPISPKESTLWWMLDRKGQETQLFSFSLKTKTLPRICLSYVTNPVLKKMRKLCVSTT